MRLDKWLKVSRLIKRRTVANELCDQGRVFVNGRVAKASHEVQLGDRIRFRMGPRETEVEITAWQPKGAMGAFQILAQQLLPSAPEEGP